MVLLIAVFLAFVPQRFWTLKTPDKQLVKKTHPLKKALNKRLKTTR